jgi:hypothetical protein
LFGHGARCGFTGLASVLVDGHGGGAVVAWFRRAENGSRGAAPAGDAPVIPARRTPRTGTRRRTTLNVRPPELPGDREDFSQREDFSLV